MVWSILGHHVAPDLFEQTGRLSRQHRLGSARLPRVLLAALVGAGLAVVGAVLQSITRNPLADPHLLGVSSGGALGAIIALLHTPD